MDIRENAERILKEYGLLEKFGRYGIVHIVGSYKMNLMTWNDLDINIENEKYTPNMVFSLSNDLNEILKPYRFEGFCIEKERSYFYGCETYIIGEPWNIDIWFKNRPKIIETEKNNEKVMEYITANPSLKNVIIEIKLKLIELRLYGIQKFSNKHYHSNEIYNAVLNEGIKNFNDFIEKYPK